MYERQFEIDNLAAMVADVLGSGRAGLVTDIDGTISPIEAMPEQARVLPTARQALARLRGRLAVVAVVSGRTAIDARTMVDLDGLTYIGNHGLEILTPDGPRIVPEARPWVPRIARVLETLEREITRARANVENTADALDGVGVENKGATGSLHYRLASDPERARITLLELLAQHAVTSGLRLEEGRMVINLLPPLTVSKGSAVAWLAKEHRLERMVYFGDDVTDAHAFKALSVLRQNHSIETLSVGVVGRETPASVRQLGDANVPSVEAVARLLAQISERLDASATMDAGVPTARGHTTG